MKVLMLLANPVRELYIYQKIEKALHEIDSTVSTLIIQPHELFQEALRFKPDIVFCFLLLDNTYPKFLIALKYLLNFKLIIYAHEGSFNHEDPKAHAIWSGVGDFSVDLIDYVIFWGRISADIIGDIYVRIRKLHNKHQVFYAGYPLYEDHFQYNTDLNINQEKLLDVDEVKFQKYENYIVLFASSFILAYYDEKQIKAADDLLGDKMTAEEKDNYIRLIVAESDMLRRYRDDLINELEKLAINNEDVLFVYKMHPWEVLYNKISVYERLRQHDNVIIIDYKIQFSVFLHRCSLFIHMGSTSVVEAYLAGVPSCFLFDSRISDYRTKHETKFIDTHDDFFWPSTFKTEFRQLDSFINHLKLNQSSYVLQNDKTEEILFNFFNLEYKDALSGVKKYRPSMEIAMLILTKDIHQSINNKDVYLAEALRDHYVINKILSLCLTEKYDDSISEYFKLLLKALREGYYAKIINSILSANGNKQVIIMLMYRYVYLIPSMIKKAGRLFKNVCNHIQENLKNFLKKYA